MSEKIIKIRALVGNPSYKVGENGVENIKEYFEHRLNNNPIKYIRIYFYDGDIVEMAKSACIVIKR